MTPRDIRLVQTSFDSLWSVYGELADRFYERLFALEPEVRRLFPREMGQQKQKFMQMLASSVGLLEQRDLLRTVVHDLGARHAAYGVRAAHFDGVRTALLESLADVLGPRFDSETRAAWEVLFSDVRATMLEAMNNAA